MPLARIARNVRRASRFLIDRATISRLTEIDDDMGGHTEETVVVATDVHLAIAPYRLPSMLLEDVGRLEAHSRWILYFEVDQDVRLTDHIFVNGITIIIEARQDPMTYGTTQVWLGTVIE
jgi:hypothetical protein